MEDRHKEWIAWAVLAVVLIVAGLSDAPVCRETYVRYGLVMETCHDGAIRQTATLSVGDVRRGATGRVAFNALAHYTVAAADGVQTVVVPEVSALALTLVARPAAVLICLAPFRFSLREKLFISWVGLRGAVSVFLASIPMLVGLPGAHFYFDVAFVVVMLSLLIQGWTIGVAGKLLRVGLPRIDVRARRTELDLPGTLKHELVGYPVIADSPYLRRGITPSWAKLTLVVRDQRVHTPEEAAEVRAGDHVYFLAPPDRVQVLDRFFAERPPRASPDAALVEDFFVPGGVMLGALAEIYGLTIPPEDAGTPLADYFAAYFIKHPPRANDAIPLGPVKLVAHTVTDDRVVTVGLQLAEPEPAPRTIFEKIAARARRVWRRLLARMRRAKS